MSRTTSILQRKLAELNATGPITCPVMRGRHNDLARAYAKIISAERRDAISKVSRTVNGIGPLRNGKNQL